jgi:hypothetical protein
MLRPQASQELVQAVSDRTVQGLGISQTTAGTFQNRRLQFMRYQWRPFLCTPTNGATAIKVGEGRMYVGANFPPARTGDVALWPTQYSSNGPWVTFRNWPPGYDVYDVSGLGTLTDYDLLFHISVNVADGHFTAAIYPTLNHRVCCQQLFDSAEFSIARFSTVDGVLTDLRPCGADIYVNVFYTDGTTTGFPPGFYCSLFGGSSN